MQAASQNGLYHKIVGLKIMKSIVLCLFIFTPSLIGYSQNCNYNGTWNGSSCDCDPGWTGPDCSVLRVLPAAPTSGYRPSNTDAWGASILKDDDGLYHMWVSVIDHNCDIEYWARNSKVIHATSSNPEGPYSYQAEAFPVMAHEVDVKRGPNNNWVAFLTAGVDSDGHLAYSDYGAACICNPSTQQPTSSCDYGASTEPTVICTASSPYGPWSDPIVILEPSSLLDGIDANFSAVVHEDGSLIGLWRTYPSGSQVHWVTASNYLDPASYTWQEQETSLFPAPYDGFTSEGLEDMFVYYDENRDVYHAIFHDMVAQDGAPFYDGLGHAYSTDGVNWTYSGEATTSHVHFTNGTTTTSARARPHFLIEDGQITHLISAEQFDDNDWSYTLVEPIENTIVHTTEHPLNSDKIISIYPQPSKGAVSLSSEYPIDKIHVYTPMGRKIKSFELKASYSFEFDLSTKGLFIVAIQLRNDLILKKIIIK